MGLYFFTALLFAIFSGLFYLASPERIVGPENYQTGVGGLFSGCNRGGVTEAFNDATFGATAGVTGKRICADHDIGQGPWLTNSQATGLYAPDIHIAARRLHDLDPAITGGRNVVTYILPDAAVNGAPYTEVMRQVQEHYFEGTTIGPVSANNGSSNKVSHTVMTGAGPVTYNSLVPLDVPVGSFAAVTRVD